MYDSNTQKILNFINGNNLHLYYLISRFMLVLKLVGYARFGGTCLWIQYLGKQCQVDL